MCLAQVVYVVLPWAGLCPSRGLFLLQSLRAPDWLLKSLYLKSNMITHYRVCPFAVCQVLPHPGTTFFLAMELLVQLFPGLTDALSTNPLSQKEGRWGLIAATH